MASPLIYDNGFSGDDNIIAKHDTFIKKIIQDQLSSDCAFINTTWLEIDKDLQKIVNQNLKKVVCYSGPDWENTVCRREQHSFIEKNQQNIIHVGNKLGKNYFSFWLDFVFTHLLEYEKFDVWNLNTSLKTFMCLNRKPHVHRIELMKDLYDNELIKDNYVSLGIFSPPAPWDYKGLSVPIKLERDIRNETGEMSVSGDAGGITNDITGLGHQENWNSHFLNVVTETTVHTDAFLSEKIFKPIIGMRPFVVLGDDNVYKVLQDWGFDTFDDLFGTGYTGRYYTDRINWIVDIIENLQKEKKLQLLLTSLKSRLEYNKHQFKKIALNNRHKIYNLGL